jgi:uncharacterized membrane protein
MALLISGIIVFFGMHLISAMSLKNEIQNRFGAQNYKIVFAVVSLVGFLLIIFGKANAPYSHVWNAMPQLRVLTLPVMWACMILLPAAHMKGNLKRWIKHPMLLGVLLWSCSHLLVNGDLTSILLFGSFGLYSIEAMISQSRRGAQKQTVVMPFKNDLIVFAAGTTVFVVIILLHGSLFGVPLR